MTPAGVVRTIADPAGNIGSADGGSAASFTFSPGVSVDGTGDIFVTDAISYTIRRGVAVAPGDFSSDGKEDLVWSNSTSGDRGFWLMHGPGYASAVGLVTLSTDWRIAAAGDFNGYGNPDIRWKTRSRGIAASGS